MKYFIVTVVIVLIFISSSFGQSEGCRVVEFPATTNWSLYFDLSGTFVKGVSIINPDKSLTFSSARSNTDTVYILELEASHSKWLTNQMGVHGISSSKSASILDAPIEVKYDKYTKKYTYTVKLVVHKPFTNDDQRELLNKMIDLCHSSEFLLGRIPHSISNSEAFINCFYEALVNNK